MEYEKHNPSREMAGGLEIAQGMKRDVVFGASGECMPRDEKRRCVRSVGRVYAGHFWDLLKDWYCRQIEPYIHQ